MPKLNDSELGGERILGLLNRYYAQDQWQPSAAQALSVWLSLVVTWNRKMDLTAARDAHELFDIFVADSIILHRARQTLGIDSTWLDVGCGPGAPGLGMAILDPTLPIALVEPNAKRVAFLRQVIGRIKLTQVRVICSRLEGLQREMADEAVSRATLAPDDWCRHGLPLVRRRVWLLLGREPWQPPVGCNIEYDASYRWPHTGAARRVLALSRAQEHSDR